MGLFGTLGMGGGDFAAAEKGWLAGYCLLSRFSVTPATQDIPQGSSAAITGPPSINIPRAHWGQAERVI